MALAVLSIDLEARLAKLEEGMSRATRVAEKNAAAIEARYARIGTAVRTVAGVVATAFAGVSLVGLVRGTIAGVDALDDLKDATGASIENLSALEDIAARTGTGFDDMASTLVRFNKVLSEAKPGSEGASIFKSLGLDVERLRALDPAEALRQVAEALAKFSDDGNKARIVQELFGKSVRQAAPLLNELAKAGKLNATYTTEQAEEAKKLNQQLLTLEKNATDLGRSIASVLVPNLNKLLESLNKLGVAGTLKNIVGLDVQGQLESEAKVASEKVNGAMATLKRLSAELSADPGNDALANKVERARKRVEALTADALEAAERLKDLAGVPRSQRDLLRDMEGSFKPGLRAPGGGSSGTAKAGEIDDATRSLAQYVAVLDRELSATKELSEEQQALNFLKSLGARGEIPQVRELVLGLAAEVDARRDAAGMTKLQADALRDLNRAEDERKRRLQDLLSGLPSARGAELGDLAGDLDEAFLKGKVGPKQYAEAVAELDKRLAGLQPPIEKAKNELDEFSKQAARNIQDALGDTVLATLKGNFDSIGQLWGDLIQRMAAQALSAKLGELLLGSFGTTGQVGGLFGSLFGLFMHQGGIAGVDGKATRYHSGGVAGLRADEVPAILLRGEEVIPRGDRRHRNNGRLQPAAAPVTIINNVDGGMNRNEVYSAMALLRDSLRGEFMQTLRQHGLA